MPERVYSTPLLDKLGVRPGMRVAIVGDIDPAVVASSARADRRRHARATRSSTPTSSCWPPTRSMSWRSLRALRSRIRQAGAIWVVSRKGRAATLRDVDVIAAARDADLVDNKVASFSDTHTALRLVIPKALRTDDGPGPRGLTDPSGRPRLGARGARGGCGQSVRWPQAGGRAAMGGRCSSTCWTPWNVVRPVRDRGRARTRHRAAWSGSRGGMRVRVVNPDPARGLSSSLRLGLDACAAEESLDGAFILLGDQPLTAVSTLMALSSRGLRRDRGWCRCSRPGLRRRRRCEPGAAAPGRLPAGGAARSVTVGSGQCSRSDPTGSTGCRCPAATRTWTPSPTCVRCEAGPRSPTGRRTAGRAGCGRRRGLGRRCGGDRARPAAADAAGLGATDAAG